jgi:hypothetical protein
MIFQNHRRLPVCMFSVKMAALWSLKRVTERIFLQLVSNFKEPAKTLSLISYQRGNKKLKNPSAHVQKVPISLLVTQSL